MTKIEAKNEAGAAEGVFEVTPGEMTARGEALACAQDRPIFLSFSLPGERILAKEPVERNGELHSEPVRILAPSPERIAPACQHFADCGGCKLQHWRESSYRRWKENLVVSALARHGIDMPKDVEATFVPAGTRRRADLAAMAKGNVILLGFHAAMSDRIVDVGMCPVLAPAIVRALPALRRTLSLCLREGERADILATESQTGLDILIETARGADKRARSALMAMAGGSAFARIAWRKGDGSPEIICQFRQPRITLDGVGVDLPMPSFLQPSQEGEAAIRRSIAAWLGKPKLAAELFCGLGTFTFGIAALARVFAADGARPAIEALRKALREAGLEKRIEAAWRDLDRSPLGLGELERFDAVVLDPPRAGARAQAVAIATSNVARVIYVSCNPASFARDARLMIDGGYMLTNVHVLDQFRWSAHVELVGLFQKKTQRGQRSRSG